MLNKEEAQTIADLELRAFSDPWSLKSVEGTLCQKDYINLGVWREGKLLGYLFFSCILDEGEIIRIAVEPDERRRGIAESLFRTLREECLEKGIFKWMLDVRSGNEAALACYRKIGFSEDGRRKAFYKEPVEDAILMSCKLR